MLYKSRIGSTFSEDTTIRFSTFNCLQNESNTEVYCAVSVKDAQRAAILATEAFRQFKKTDVSVRADFLNGIADELELQRSELIQMYCKESSLSAQRANSPL